MTDQSCQSKTSDTATSQKKLQQLLTIINDTIGRNKEALNRYAIMNNGLTGCGPVTETDDTNKVGAVPNGLINELIEQAECLYTLCHDFDCENNRLNQIIIDG